MAIETIIVAAYRPHPYYDRNWDHNRAVWENFGLPIYEADDGREPFTGGSALNSTLLVEDWELALYVGVDFFPERLDQVSEALTLAERTGKFTLAFDRTVLLSQEASEEVLAGRMPSRTGGSVHGNAFTGISVIPRALFEEVGGFDERMIGWGWEDQAFWAACCAMGGGFERVRGYMYHLWHPRSREENEEQPYHEANGVLGRRYLEAKGNREAMLEILTEPGGPRS